uniref:CHK kinase-like domain-containing protein n=1 Tax=Bicosoecida sp. CB-2014 TaxID=1486930 RepID=A0A7S1CAB7_9STRA
MDAMSTRSLVAASAAGIAIVTGAAVLLAPSLETQRLYWKLKLRAYVYHGRAAVGGACRRLFSSADADRAPAAGDASVSRVWLRRQLQECGLFEGEIPPIASVEIMGDALQGGFVGDMSKLSVKYEGEEDGASTAAGLPHVLVFKTVKGLLSTRLAALFLGHAREGLFYRHFGMKGGKFAHLLPASKQLPRVVYADGDVAAGTFSVLMEEIGECRTLSHMLGNQCWGPPPPLPAGAPTDHAVLLRAVFLEEAETHAALWQKRELLDIPWLKHVDWLRGKNRAQWVLGVEDMKKKWAMVTRLAPPDLYAGTIADAMDTLFAATSWEAFQASMDISDPTLAWTLAHGDFHGGNQLWATERVGASSRPPVVSVDFAEMGVFCPFRDISQYVISNATIEVRRKHERELFEAYYARLLELGVDGTRHPLNRAWALYCAGGIERWLQMIVLMGYMSATSPVLPVKFMRWFVKQVGSFIEDHEADIVASGVYRGISSGYCMVTM